MPLVQTSAPGTEPVTLAEAKNHLRVDSDLTQDDALITLLIGAARRYAEMYCARSFITQQWSLVLDSFPGPSQIGVPYGRLYSLPAHAIQLERGPVVSIESIQYQDLAASWQTMPSNQYVADLTGPVPRVTPIFGQIWPVNLPQIGSVKVNYTAGYGDATAVPEGIKQWMLLRLTTLYRNREEVAVLGRGKVDPLPFVDGLLDPYRVVFA